MLFLSQRFRASVTLLRRNYIQSLHSLVISRARRVPALLQSMAPLFLVVAFFFSLAEADDPEANMTAVGSFLFHELKTNFSQK